MFSHSPKDYDSGLTIPGVDYSLVVPTTSRNYKRVQIEQGMTEVSIFILVDGTLSKNHLSQGKEEETSIDSGVTVLAVVRRTFRTGNLRIQRWKSPRIPVRR